MSLFQKIFLSVMAAFLMVFFSLAYLLNTLQVTAAEKSLIDRNVTVADFIAKEIEVGYLESSWPFEGLHMLSQEKDSVFWWIVDNQGSIYIADRADFIGSRTDDYFPDIGVPSEDGATHLNRGDGYGIRIKPFSFDAGRTRWSFWLGFSLREIDQARRTAAAYSLMLFFAVALLVAPLIYVIVRHFTRPIRDLARGTRLVSYGDLSYRLKNDSRDELGQLADDFNAMTSRLKSSYGELEKKVQSRTEELAQSKKEVEDKLRQMERMNRLMVGREMMMIELKKRLAKTEAELADRDSRRDDRRHPKKNAPT